MVGVLWLGTTVAIAAQPADFRLQQLDGSWFRLADNLGQKVIYINFWATWCTPCRREMPHLQQMHEELGDQGLMVIGINTDPASNKSKIKPFAKRHKLSYPTLLDPDNNVHDTYNSTRELPFAILVDRQGNIHKTYAGYRTGDEKLLLEDIQKLLSVPESVPATADRAAD
jgi:peroxiredoxin